MDALTQAEVFALIGELNGFIEKWDPRLVTQEREYQAKRTRIIAENNAEKTRREKAYKQECETLSRQSAKMIEDAQKILEDVDQMDQQLMSSDKYYSKTKTRKEAELAGVESQAYRNRRLNSSRSRLIDTTKNICPTVSPASTMNRYARRSDTLFRSIVCRINAIALLSRIV